MSRPSSGQASSSRPIFAAEEMAPLWKTAVEAFISERTLSMQTGILGTSVAEAEVSAAGLREQASHLQPPARLEGWTLQEAAHSLTEHRAQLLNAAADTEYVLARARSRVADYLAQTEQQIAFGQVGADVWERNRAFVDVVLARVAPQVLDQFQAAYRRQAADEPEARSQAQPSAQDRWGPTCLTLHRRREHDDRSLSGARVDTIAFASRTPHLARLPW